MAISALASRSSSALPSWETFHELFPNAHTADFEGMNTDMNREVTVARTKNLIERFLTLFTDVRAGKGITIVLLAFSAFLRLLHH